MRYKWYLTVVVLVAATMTGCGGGGGGTSSPTPSGYDLQTVRWTGSWEPVKGSSANVGDLVNFQITSMTVKGGVDIEQIETTLPNGAKLAGPGWKGGLLLQQVGTYQFAIKVVDGTTLNTALTVVMPKGLIPIYADNKIPLIRRDGVYLCDVSSRYIVPTIDGVIPWGETIKVSYSNGTEVTSELQQPGPNGFGCLKEGSYSVRFTSKPEYGIVTITAINDFIGKG